MADADDYSTVHDLNRLDSEIDVEQWFRDAFPNDLGDDNHRWSWLVKAATSREDLPPAVANYVPTTRDILWLHRCKGKPSAGWIDLTSGTKHRLLGEDPLHIEPSIGCPVGCGDHGFVRDGRWVAA